MATTYDKASLVLIPSGTKEGVIFSQKPTNGDGDFTFSRSTSATRVGPSGYIEKETQNLLLQSNSFDVSANWTATGTLTSGQSGYDGTNDAWLMTNGNIVQSITNIGVQTFSIYAKANTLDWIFMDFVGVPSEGAYFDVSNGVIGTIDSGSIDAKIEAAGNGFYKCSIVINTSSATAVRMYTAIADGNVSGSGSVYIQDAQLEQGLVARDYIETTTAAVEGGITDNVPRLDYTDASCPALKLEPQRTNLVTHSEYIAAGSLVNILTESNSVVSPDGGQNATKLIRNTTAGGAAWVAFFNTGSAGNDVVYSVFAKAGTNNILCLTYYDGTTGDLFFNFDLSSGSISSVPSGSAYYVDSGIEDYGNGWYRCYAVIDSQISTAQYQLSAGTNRGGELNEYIYVYGAMSEVGSYPTSYIPTYGTSVTRNADAAYKTGITSLIGQTEGTLYLDLNITTIDSNSFLFGVYGGGNEIYFRGATNNRISFVHYYGGTQAGIFTSTLLEGRHKLAACYKNNDWVLYLDGSLVGTDASGSFVGGMNNVTFGYSAIGAYPPFESVNKALLFKTRLTNEELEALTQV